MRAEAIGAATVGRAASQARATVAISASRSCGDLVEGGEHLAAALRLQVLARLRGAGALHVRTGRYLPVRKPEASAKYGTAARPARAAVSWSGPS
ncbi:hypothetical protein SMICM17S_07082 [Streptomyces microflavus]